MENNEENKVGTPEGIQEDTLREIEPHYEGQPTPNNTTPMQGAPSYYGQPAYQEPMMREGQPAAQAQYSAQQQYSQPQQPNNYQGQPGNPYSQQAQPWVYRSGDGTPPRSVQPRQRRTWPAILITAVCFLLIGELIGGLILPGLLSKNSQSTADSQPRVEAPKQESGSDTDPAIKPSSDTEPGAGQDPSFSFGDNQQLSYVTSGSLADMAEAVTPSIVGILNLQYLNNNNPYYGYYGYGHQQQNNEPVLEEVGSGSGVIISEDGYIVTNAHVVEGQDALKVLIDGEKVDAVLVGSDSVTDLAVVKIDRTGLSAATLGDSDKVRVGELAVAIGNPLGNDLAGTVTMGIISAKDRTIEVDNQYIDVLQTDAAINPGNSGGALVDQNGLVIGITSAKTVLAGYDSQGNAISAEGIGYAIPINNAKPIIEQLIHTGSVPRPALGVTVQYVTNRIDSTQKGILITSVNPGSCAEKAGLKVNDVIRTINGKSFESLSDFKKLLMTHQVGETITLTVERDNQTLEIKVTLMDSSELNTNSNDQKGSQWSIPGYGGYTPFG